MKVSREQVSENKRNILKAARRLFAARGFESVTIADVMKEAGLTHGGFYGHFRSKNDLVAQACAHAVTGHRRQQERSLAEYASYYLTDVHRDDRARGCAFAALGGEAVRQPLEVRHEMTEGLKAMVARFSESAPGSTAEIRRAAGIAAFSTMVGGLLLSRLATDASFSDELLAAVQADLGSRLKKIAGS